MRTKQIQRTQGGVIILKINDEHIAEVLRCKRAVFQAVDEVRKAA